MSVPPSVSRCVALVAMDDPVLERSVRRRLERTGHEVVLADSTAQALSASLSRPVSVAVADVAHARSVDGADLIRALRHLRPGCQVVVAHGEDDVAGMWTTFRTGGRPWSVSTDRRDRSEAPLRTGPSPLGGGELALEALHHEILGQHAAACAALGRLDAVDVDDALDALVEAGAAALERLHGRARYPVSTQVLLSQLPEHVGTFDHEAFDLWWTMVETMAFRASGLRLDPPEAEPDTHHQAPVFGAFHAAAVLLRFTARRHWRRPSELLVDLADTR